MRANDALRVAVWFDGVETDITERVTTVNVRRGRANATAEIESGKCQVTFLNIDRALDPPWPGGSPGPLGAISPGQQLQVTWNGTAVFTGHIDDWSHTYPTARAPAMASCTASDALARLAQRSIIEWFPQSGQRPGARLASLLAHPDVAWSGPSSFQKGAMALHGAPVRNTDALSYARLVARSDGGRFFAAADNTLTYRGVNQASLPGATLTFSDGPGGVHGMNAVDVTYGSQEWYTQVNVTSIGGVTQTAQSDSSITDLHNGGFRPYNLPGLLMRTDAGARNLAQYLLSVFESLEPWVSSLECRIDRLSDVQGAAVMGLEIGDRVATDWTPTGAGGPADQTLAVEGVADTYVPNLWTRTLALSRLIGVEGWVVGTSQIGTGTLGL